MDPSTSKLNKRKIAETNENVTEDKRFKTDTTAAADCDPNPEGDQNPEKEQIVIRFGSRRIILKEVVAHKKSKYIQTLLPILEKRNGPDEYDFMGRSIYYIDENASEVYSKLEDLWQKGP